ncbi:alpha/beta hydrolase [Reyranella soli]|uniref:alpha/beta hydrolase n=1 Tax=Reyranella soli TaxID=1230389 RepID=UPI0011BEC913|nr:alpha/beta hydrolase [Reyranella soli]
MTARLFRLLRRTLLLLVVVAATLLAVRTYDSQRGAPLQLWHTHVPHDMRAADIDKADWQTWLKAEDAVFHEVRTEVVDKLDAESRTASNRYFAGSPIYPGNFKQDWNRSYVLEPAGPPAGAVVLLHGLTDSPYSLRHIARRYRDRGFVVVGIRLPAHGTVPAALTDVEWEDWDAATRLAVREARRRAGPAVPLHIVGFSNGGALAVKYALDAMEDNRLVQADRLILVSPMIGITAFARFAGLAALPAMFPAFAKAAWLGLLPEFNPFKYNSFPVNGARQSHRLTVALQDRLARAARDGRLQRMPPILTFQSVVDFTVSTRAVIASLYALLPANGSELVLFDLNRAAKISSELMRNASETVLTRILADPPRNFRTTIIANVSDDRQEVQERVTEAGAVTEQTRDLGLAFPPGLFSLSHVALPFPMYDALYGLEPNEPEDFGVNLGAIAPRGERGVLIVDLDALVRVSSNPFFPYILERLGEAKP